MAREFGISCLLKDLRSGKELLMVMQISRKCVWQQFGRKPLISLWSLIDGYEVEDTYINEQEVDEEARDECMNLNYTAIF
ncbi:unnamed protein product [Arabidopsis halleri]